MLKDDCIVTVAQTITDRLRQDIIDGRYKAGERITVSQISQDYHVSAMPVREAFQCLKGEHLIELLQYKGAIIKDLDAKSVSDIYDVRGAIEVLIMENICKNGLPPEKAEELAAINDSIDFAQPSLELNQYFTDTNERFHQALFEICDNQQAKNMYVFYSNLLRALKKRYPLSVERIRASQAEHRGMLEALSKGDLEETRRISVLHAQGAKSDLLKQMEENGANKKGE